MKSFPVVMMGKSKRGWGSWVARIIFCAALGGAFAEIIWMVYDFVRPKVGEVSHRWQADPRHFQRVNGQDDSYKSQDGGARWP